VLLAGLVGPVPIVMAGVRRRSGSGRCTRLVRCVSISRRNSSRVDPALKDEAVRLIVLSVVTEEMDELKRRAAQRQKAQARKILTTLWDLHRAKPSEPAALPQSPDITIEVLLDGGWHQRMPNNDGEIIDQAAGLRDLTGRPVILASGDYTQLYRAAPAGLTAVLMPRPDEA
jgi:PIN domain